MRGGKRWAVVEGGAFDRGTTNVAMAVQQAALVCATLDEVRDVVERAPDVAHAVRAVLALYIPRALVALLSAVGIAAIRLDAAGMKALKGQASIALRAHSPLAEERSH